MKYAVDGWITQIVPQIPHDDVVTTKMMMNIILYYNYIILDQILHGVLHWLDVPAGMFFNSFLPRTIRDWNALATDPLLFQSVDAFKNYLVTDASCHHFRFSFITFTRRKRTWLAQPLCVCLLLRSRTSNGRRRRSWQYSSRVSKRPHTTIPVGILRPGRQCCHSAASAFRQLSTTCSASLAYRLNTYGRRAFSVDGRPHSLELSHGGIRDPTISAECFRRLLKTYLFARYSCTQRVRGSWRLPRYINQLTYLLTCLRRYG